MRYNFFKVTYQIASEKEPRKFALEAENHLDNEAGHRWAKDRVSEYLYSKNIRHWIIDSRFTFFDVAD